MSDLGKTIRELRKACGMSQMALADKIGITYQQIQKYEKGTSKLSVPRLIQIADVFGVPVTAFLNGDSKAKDAAAQSTFSEDEAQLLMLYRNLHYKNLKEGFLSLLKDILSLSHGKVIERR